MTTTATVVLAALRLAGLESFRLPKPHLWGPGMLCAATVPWLINWLALMLSHGEESLS